MLFEVLFYFKSRHAPGSRCRYRLAVDVVLGIASSGVFVMQTSASSYIGRAAQGARSAASGLYVAFYYLGGSAGATALVVPWRLGGWPAVIGTIVLVQCITLAVAWRYFSTAPAEQSAEAIFLE